MAWGKRPWPGCNGVLAVDDASTSALIRAMAAAASRVVKFRSSALPPFHDNIIAARESFDAYFLLKCVFYS